MFSVKLKVRQAAPNLIPKMFGKLLGFAIRSATDNKNNRKAFLRTFAVLSVLMDKRDQTTVELIRKAALEDLQAEVRRSQAEVDAQVAAAEEKSANAALIRAKADAIGRESKAKEIKIRIDSLVKAVEAFAKLERAGGALVFSELVELVEIGKQELPNEQLIALAASKLKYLE